MKKGQVSAQIDFKGKKGTVVATISLLLFKEGDHYIVYSPHLDVSGYGESEEKAKQSFTISMNMFLDYTTNKRTLHKELISLGWKLQKGTPNHPIKVIAPKWETLLKRNSQLEQLFSTQDITTSRQEIAIPV